MRYNENTRYRIDGSKICHPLECINCGNQVDGDRLMRIEHNEPPIPGMVGICNTQTISTLMVLNTNSRCCENPSYRFIVSRRVT